MRKQEIGDLMLRLYSHIDQADIQDSIYKLMRSAPISLQKEFIELLVTSEYLWDTRPDSDDLKTAQKLVGIKDN